VSLLVASLWVGTAAKGAEGPTITEPVTIEFWFQSDVLAETESWQRAIDRFRDIEPNVTVNMTSIPFTDFERQMPLALDAGTGPDVATVPPLASGQDRYVQAGHLLDLTPIAEEHGWLEHYPAWAVEYNNSITPGQVYGIPYGITDEAVFYNGELFEEHGLEPPESFEDLEDLNQTLQDAGVTPLSVGGRDGWPLVNVWGHFVQGNIPNEYSAQLEALDPGVTYDDPRIVEATERFVDWFQKGWFAPNAVATDYGTANSQFVSEEVASTLTGTWALAQFVEEPDFTARFFAFPPMDPEVGWNDSGLAPYNDIVIPADTAHLDAAVAFVDYILGEENMLAFWNEGNIVPYQFDELPPPAHPVQADVIEAMNKVTAGRYMGVSSPEMLQAFTSNLQKAVNGDLTPAEAVQGIEATYRDVVGG
jgi:ABC-type glycerol-3-phosphate transport system substrate-binding protein